MDTAKRREWMGALATAPADRLFALWEAVPDKPEATYPRPAEIGMVMTKGRVGGSGAPFNLGEATVTRCTACLPDGSVGHAYLAGRDKRKAEIAAILDAMLMDPARHDALYAAVIEPLLIERVERDGARASKVAATKVDFFTLVRGED
jgi:alpha-D-ribose 1-methylphosphonate 5-triphosphate synthase subunit PhnG